MRTDIPAGGPARAETEAEMAWHLVRAVRAAVEAGQPMDAVEPGHPLRAAVEPLLPLAVAPRTAGLVQAVLGQTLDGYIATHAGDSRYINGPAGLAHLHRLRALSDAVIIGASTAALDQPRLTTRLVEGPNAVRVVVDPHGRLPAASGLLHDGAAPTLILKGGNGPEREERISAQARVIHLEAQDGRIAPARIVMALRRRGLTRLLIEGGGETVSRFLAAGQLDRLQLLVAPILLGAGRPAVRLPPVERLAGALRPAWRRFVLGEDTLFDLDLGRPASVLASEG